MYLLTVLHAGGKFDKDTYKVSGGLTEELGFFVNALSKHLKMTIYREGKFIIKNLNVEFLTPLEIIGDSPRKTGTTIEFLADDTIFWSYKNEFSILAKDLEVAYLNSFISITFR